MKDWVSAAWQLRFSSCLIESLGHLGQVTFLMCFAVRSSSGGRGIGWIKCQNDQKAPSHTPGPKVKALKPTVGTLQLQAGSASPCLLPGTQQALPCQHGLNLNLLNCKVTQTSTALQHPHKTATARHATVTRVFTTSQCPPSSRPRGHPPPQHSPS